MKKTIRTVALILAVVLTAGLLAFPAAASNTADEEKWVDNVLIKEPLKAFAIDLDIFPVFDEKDRKAGVLTEGHVFFFSDIGIFKVLGKETLCQRTAFFFCAAAECVKDVPRQLDGSFAAKGAYRFHDSLKRNDSFH